MRQKCSTPILFISLLKVNCLELLNRFIETICAFEGKLFKLSTICKRPFANYGYSFGD